MLFVMSKGENNLAECLGPHNIPDGRTAPGGGPRACGIVNESTGCELQTRSSCHGGVAN